VYIALASQSGKSRSLPQLKHPRWGQLAEGGSTFKTLCWRRMVSTCQQPVTSKYPHFFLYPYTRYQSWVPAFFSIIR
jgi:hypothetical protein